MTFTTAPDAKIASDGVSIDDNPAVGSLTETKINAGIVTQQDLAIDSPIYTATFTLDADLNGRVSPIDIIQSDNSTILLIDLIRALNDAGHRTSYNAIKIRDGKRDKVRLTIAWD